MARYRRILCRIIELGQKRGGCWERDYEALDGAESYYVEGGGGKSFGAGILYIDVRQCKGAGDFAEEGCLFEVGFDQGEGDAGVPEFDGESGEAGAGAEVGWSSHFTSERM